MVALEVLEKTYNIAEYLAHEDAAMTRHEFYNGTITEMAGGTILHNAVKGEMHTNINICIRQAKLPHVVLNSDTKVRIERTNSFVYPDVTVSDEMPECYITPDGNLRRDTITNPLLIVEVLSESTRDHDKGDKFDDYCTIPGFREYVLVEPESVWVKSCYLQDPERGLWKIQTLTDRADTLTLHSLQVSLPLADIYAVLEKLPETR
jgi:Uma2 family endonuclease